MTKDERRKVVSVRRAQHRALLAARRVQNARKRHEEAYERAKRVTLGAEDWLQERGWPNERIRQELGLPGSILKAMPEQWTRGGDAGSE